MSRRPFSLRPEILGRFSTNRSSPAGRAEGAWYTFEVVWALTGAYIDKKCAIWLTKLQNQQFFRQQALPGKVKFSSSAASNLKISHHILH